jgi:diguanylate cyclase (GGDEF)-like protein
MKENYAILMSQYRFLKMDIISKKMSALASGDYRLFYVVGKSLDDPILNSNYENYIYSIANVKELDGVASLASTLVPYTSNERYRSFTEQFDNENFIDIGLKHEKRNSIVVKNASMMEQIIDHLVEVGAKTFAFISGPSGNSDSDERYAGFKEGLAKHGFIFDEHNFYTGDYTQTSGIDVAIELHKTKSIPDAVVCANDEMAIGFMNRMLELGVEIPNDVLVTGFDNCRATQNQAVTITTMEQPFDQMIEEGIHLLRGMDTYFKLGGYLHQRESTGNMNEIHGSLQLENKMLSSKYQLLEDDFYKTLEMSSYFASVSNLTQFKNALKVMFQTFENREIYVNVFNDVLKVDDPLQFTFPEEVKCIYGLNKKEDVSNKLFSTKDIVPVDNSTNSYFVYPLHKEDEAYGYIVCDIETAVDIKFTALKDILNITMNRIMMLKKINEYSQSLEKLSQYDSLTDVLNRRGFEKTVKVMFKESMKKNQSPCIVYCDIDYLKIINDEYGHLVGDEVIKKTANLLQRFFKDGVVSRIGGDEFIVYLDHLPASEFESVIEKFDNFILFESRKSDLPISVSIGIGNSDEVEEDLNTLIKYADEMLYERKSRR